MKLEQTSLAGVVLIEPHVFADDRGFFVESFNEKHFATYGLPIHFRQDNRSRSRKGVLRGLHFQRRHPQGKLVTVITGHVFDVAVDLRPGSRTFGQWHGVHLFGDEPRSLWIPPGFAHGLCVLSDVADVTYKCTELYAPQDEAGIAWDDPAIGIEWPIDKPLLSRKDQGYAPFSQLRVQLQGQSGSSP